MIFQWKSINYISISSQFSGKFAIWPFRGQTSYLILGIFQLVKNPLFSHLIFISYYWNNSFRPKFISLTKIFWIGLLFDPSKTRILPKNTHFSTETPFNDVSITLKTIKVYDNHIVYTVMRLWLWSEAILWSKMLIFKRAFHKLRVLPHLCPPQKFWPLIRAFK